MAISIRLPITRTAALSSAAALLLLVSQPSLGQPLQSASPKGSRTAANAADSFPELVIAGHTVMRLRASAGALTPEERAYSLRQRLGPILTLPNLTAEDIQVRQRRPGQTASIYVRRRLLVTVDRNLAKANNTSIEGLAQQWARNLRQALPQVNVAVRMSAPTSWNERDATDTRTDRTNGRGGGGG